MNQKGFTLIELMIVISIIISLLAIGFFPYSYYMERAQVESTVDMISQEWILAHRAVRNGLLYDDERHASLEIDFSEGSGTIAMYLSTGSTSEKKLYKTLTLESKIIITEFSGSGLTTDTAELKYTISPPYATGAFAPSASGIILSVGYPGATKESRRVQDILLRPYYGE